MRNNQVFRIALLLTLPVAPAGADPLSSVHSDAYRRSVAELYERTEFIASTPGTFFKDENFYTVQILLALGEGTDPSSVSDDGQVITVRSNDDSALTLLLEQSLERRLAWKSDQEGR